MKHSRIKILLSLLFVLFFSEKSFAKNLELTSNEYKKMIQSSDQKKFVAEMQNYSALVIKFSKGDLVQVKIDGTLFKSSEKTASYVEVKEPFYLKIPIGNGEIRISKDNKTYKDIRRAFTGNIGIGASLDQATSDILILNSTLNLKPFESGSP